MRLQLRARNWRKGAGAAVLALALAGPAFAAKDTLVVGMTLEPPGLDPTAGAASAIREVTWANIYEGLVRIDAQGDVKPALARSWEMSADGKVYTFKLASGVKFHDGAAFDCSVVKFSYERAVAPDSTNAQKAIFAPIEKTECPDPATAVVTLKHPAANFLFNMGWGDAVMISPASAANNKTTPVGTGPFKFKTWVKGDRVELVKNADYWGTPAKLSAVTFRFVSDPSAATAAMMAGDIDAFPGFQAAEAVAQFKANPKFAVKIGFTQGKTILGLNNAKKPFDDPRVRRALAHAIDRKQLLEATYSGFGTVIGSHYAPTDPGYLDLANAYPYDPAKAKALLAEAGIKPGFEMTIHLPPPVYARRGGEVIAAFLQQVGVNAKLVPVEFPQWLDQVFRRSEFDATIISHTEARDIEIYAREKYYFNYANADFKPLYKAYTEETDHGKRVQIAQQMQRKLSEDQPNVFLYLLPKIGVWNAKVQGLWDNIPIPANDMTAVSWAD